MKTKKARSTKKRHSQNKQNPLDRISAFSTNPNQKARGRPRKLPWDTVTGRASNYEIQLGEVWDRLATPLLSARTVDEVTRVFRQFAQPYAEEFVPRLSADILLLLNDSDFPQRPSPRIKFLARSLAGRSTLSFRSSRDICEKAAAHEKRKSPHRILRREFFIECSCGYKGPALDNNCPKCGAQPQFSLYEWTGLAPSNSLQEKSSKLPKLTQQVKTEETIASTPSNPNTVQCECGAMIAAASRDVALKVLAEHKLHAHGIEHEEKTE